MLAATDADRLVAAGEEIIYLLDAEGQIPVNLEVRSFTGGVVLVPALAAADAVEVTGAVPKAISLSVAPGPRSKWLRTCDRPSRD